MNVDNLILRQTDYPPLVNKDDFLDNADFDSNMINIYDDLVALCLTNGVIAYDISTEYDDEVINYATHNGRLWKFVNAVPSVNVTPGTNELYWIEVFPTELAHRKNSDTILDEGGANEVTASEIRAFIDAGLTSTTNLSLSEQTDVSLKINSSTGADVTLLGATETTAGLLISEDKQKLNQLSGINSGDQTLESLGAEATANKVIDFSVIDNITFPTTEAVANKITSDVVALVDAELTNYATTVDLATKEDSITAGTTAQYWRGDKSWQTLDKIAIGLGNVVNVDTTNASNISSGTVPTARMGSGTADSTTYLRGDNTWGSISLAIPQVNKIYVDSINGVDSVGRGRLDNPFLTIEYALTQISNTTSFTTNTATNTTLSAISDASNALLNIGDYVSGSGIAYGSFIVAKGNQGSNANTITISKATTATATSVTLTSIRPYWLTCSGSFAPVSSIFKEGVYVDSLNANISYSDITLFSISSVLVAPYFAKLKQVDGTTSASTSIFLKNTADQVSNSIIDIEVSSFHSISTGKQIDSTSNAISLNIKTNRFDCRFGTVMYGISSKTNDVNAQGYFYGLLNGFFFSSAGTNTGSFNLNGAIETPTSINAFNTNSFGKITLNGKIIGGVQTNNATINGEINGDVTFFNDVTMNGLLRTISTTTVLGYGVSVSDIINGGTISIDGDAFVHGTSIGYIRNGIVQCVSSKRPSLTVNIAVKVLFNVSTVDAIFTILNGANYYGTENRYTVSNGTLNLHGAHFIYSYNGLNHSGGVINNYAVLTCVSAQSVYGNAVFNNYGSLFAIGMLSVYGSARLYSNGTLRNFNDSTVRTTAVLDMAGTCTVILDGGSIESNATLTTVALINKNAGKLFLKGQVNIKVANSKSPIKCTANTSVSKDIYMFNVITNCDGSTYGILFAFDGTSYAPNDLVAGTNTKFENTNYSF